jgi:fructose-1,6-bisphosphatase/inositol monophosphatase family enzyme
MLKNKTKMMSKEKKFIFETFRVCFDFINPKLNNFSEFSKFTSKLKQRETNIQYCFDVELDKMINKLVEKHKMEGNIFSEESGFYNWGGKKYRIVYDPLCNSSLAAKTFLEAACGISIFDYDYKLILSAILDYQTGIMAIVENKKTDFYQLQSRKKIRFDFDKTGTIEKNWIVFTLENKKERSHLNMNDKIMESLKNSGRILIGSGHIYWLRLAMGVIGGYTDPFGGEKLYEMFASSVAQGAGAIVTDISGKNFDPGKYLKIFENNPDFIYYPVAAVNKKIHLELLKGLTKN